MAFRSRLSKKRIHVSRMHKSVKRLRRLSPQKKFKFKGGYSNHIIKSQRSSPSNEINVLYLGMAYDIISPLKLCPDLDTLYAIDKFDYSYGYHHKYQKGFIDFDLTFAYDIYEERKIPTIETLKNEVIYCLENGFDGSVNSFVRDSIRCELDERATILSNETIDNVWILKFVYKGKIRTLKRYELNWNDAVWPEEIDHLSWIISIGAQIYIPREFTKKDGTKGIRCRGAPRTTLTKMLERSIPGALVATNSQKRWPRKADFLFDDLNIIYINTVENVAFSCGYDE